MKPFQFKQFNVHHSQSSHKVGTDGVLLGAWTALGHNPNQILDIGAGTGLIALMIAQRSFAETIDAIELHPDAYEECVENFENSRWNDRLFCYHGDVKELAEEPDLEYDLIICNPPFFKEKKTKDFSKREQARKQVSLTYNEMLNCIKKLLTPQGEFSTIIPFEDYKTFISLADKLGFKPYKITHIKGHTTSRYKRSLLQFSFQSKPLNSDELALEISRHIYTEDYKALVRDFYLNL
jgi:tRNA1Val (adenine37-N6)-methyltransferase